MAFDFLLDTSGVERKKYVYCLSCQIPMAEESRDALGRPKFKCPNCGSVLNTAY